MKMIDQEAKLIDQGISGIEQLRLVEYAARNCYNSQDKITDDSYAKFITNLVNRGHTSPLEFATLTFDLTTSRAVLAEITRHRHASFCVRSQRYVKENSTGDVSFIKPEWLTDHNYVVWYHAMSSAESAYNKLLDEGHTAQEAREVLPNSTACRIICSANVREWIQIFELRCSEAAYPQMRALALEMLKQAHNYMPIVFDNLYEKYINKGKENNV